MSAESNTIIPGAFYRSSQPGGWGDSTTRIHIPGPIVKIDKVTRQIVGVDSIPAPIQLPTHKESFSLVNPKERETCAFDRYDAEALCEGLNLALQTGNIEVVANETVKELFPKAWDKRKERIVFKRSNGVLDPIKPLSQLVEDFIQSRRVRLQSGESLEAQDGAKSNQQSEEHRKRVRESLFVSDSSLTSMTQTAPSGELESPPTAPVPPTPPGE